MRLPAWFRPVAVVLLAAGVLVYFGGRSDAIGKPFGFAAEDLEGRLVTQDAGEFAGKVVVLDIWGTWCPPCRAAVPHLNDLYSRYRDQGIEIVGIAFEHAPDRTAAVRGLRQFIREFHIEFPVLYGGQPVDTDLRHVFPDLKDFAGFPTTLVIDRTGIVREVTVGFSPTIMRKVEAAVEEALSGA